MKLASYRTALPRYAAWSWCSRRWSCHCSGVRSDLVDRASRSSVADRLRLRYGMNPGPRKGINEVRGIRELNPEKKDLESSCVPHAIPHLFARQHSPNVAPDTGFEPVASRVVPVINPVVSVRWDPSAPPGMVGRGGDDPPPLSAYRVGARPCPAVPPAASPSRSYRWCPGRL